MPVDRRPFDTLLRLWFNVEFGSSDPAKIVAPLLTFNRPVTGTFDRDVEVLVVEQQGVWLWGRSASGRYVERENASGVLWRDLDEDGAEFWLHHAAFEAATNRPASRSAQLFDASMVASIRGAVSPVPCGRWTWPGNNQTMYYRGSAVVMICEDGDDFWVVASARTERDLAWLDELGLEWDESDTRLDR